jgi:phosphonate transport system ATP-binding protein
MLVLDNLSRAFGQHLAVNAVSLEIPRGQFVGVLGPSGAGKSTLLRSINRLNEPSSGRVLWDGQDVTALKGRALRAWRARCAMIFQQFNLVGRLDVLSNVLMGRLHHRGALAGLAGWFGHEDRLLAVAALEQLDMGPYLAQRAETLSGGQQQRVGIARALVQEPEIILADEPIASLDPRNTQVVMDALKRINRDYGITVLCNLHDVDVALACCDRLVGMKAGRVVFDGPPAALTAAVVQDLYGVGADEAAALAGDGAAPSLSSPSSTPSQALTA